MASQGPPTPARADESDHTALMSQLTSSTAEKAIAAWSTYGNTETLKWLQAQGFEVALGRKIVAFFGTDTAAKIEEDPYRLLSFCATWGQVDHLARRQFKIALDDPRRLGGAIEEACYRLFGEGHTVADRPTLVRLAGDLLKPDASAQLRNRRELHTASWCTCDGNGSGRRDSRTHYDGIIDAVAVY
jgi:exodeoxyribonuclease V alpha subunit